MSIFMPINLIASIYQNIAWIIKLSKTDTSKSEKYE